MPVAPAAALLDAAAEPRSVRRSGRRLLDDALRGLVAVTIAAAVGFLLVPVLLAVSMSFDARDFLGPFPPPTLSLRWYARFFSEPYVLHGLETSLALAVCAAAVSTTIGTMAAIGIERAAPGWRDALTAVFLAPLIVPGVVIGFALLLFYSRSGIDNSFLRLLGGHVLITFPYAIRTVLAALAGIRPSLVEAALSLGANERRAFWTVTFPLVRTGIVAGTLFAFAFSLDDVAVSLFLSDPDTYTLPVALLSMMYSNFDLTIAAAAVLFIASTIVLVMVLDRVVGIDRVVGAGLYRA